MHALRCAALCVREQLREKRREFEATPPFFQYTLVRALLRRLRLRAGVYSATHASVGANKLCVACVRVCVRALQAFDRDAPTLALRAGPPAAALDAAEAHKARPRVTQQRPRARKQRTHARRRV
jgi:hypothetical protein